MEIPTAATVGASPVPDLHVKEIVHSAEREMQQLLTQRAEIMRRIGTIKHTLVGLANLFGDAILSDELLTLLDRKPSSRQPGFTRACRVVLMESGRALSSRDVWRELQRRFPEVIERHRDPIASITTVLNRLVDYAEARCALNAKGRRVWEWITDPSRTPESVLLSRPVPPRAQA